MNGILWLFCSGACWKPTAKKDHPIQWFLGNVTDGRSGVGRWLLGSVAERLVCQSRELVLVIRAAEEKP